MSQDHYTLTLEETWLDYPDPNDNAVIVYFTGCSHHCPDCHAKDLQKMLPYSESNEEMLDKITNYANRADTNKLVFLGGDPLHPHNQELVRFLVDNLKNQFDICIFTGYDINYVKQLDLKGVKYFKCGLYDKTQHRQSQKTDDKYVLASPNQDFYDGNYNKLSINGILYFNNNNTEEKE